jgi:hypothetical protein
MNLLYLSCHEVLEYDEVRMLTQIPGVNVMPMGAYWDGGKGAITRPQLDIKLKPEWVRAFHNLKPPAEEEDHRKYLSEELLDMFDVIVVMHHFDWIIHNSELMRGRNVIWRDIGQIWEDTDEHLRRIKDLGVKIVRYSSVDQYDCKVKADALIPFGKFSTDFPKWEGGTREIIALVQSIAQRADSCNKDMWDAVCSAAPNKLFGTDNQGQQNWQGLTSYPEMLQHMKNHNAFWYGGTRPAPYTLALMEAMFVGIPVVCCEDLGWETEITELLLPDQIATNIEQLKDIAAGFARAEPKDLLAVSNWQRDCAAHRWGADKVIWEWRKLLDI